MARAGGRPRRPHQGIQFQGRFCVSALLTYLQGDPQLHPGCAPPLGQTSHSHNPPSAGDPLPFHAQLSSSVPPQGSQAPNQQGQKRQEGASSRQPCSLTDPAMTLGSP